MNFSYETKNNRVMARRNKILKDKSETIHFIKVVSGVRMQKDMEGNDVTGFL